MAIDLEDPLTRRFAEALVALPPKEWDAITARLHALAAIRMEQEPPTPDQQRFATFFKRTMKLLDPSPATMRWMLRHAETFTQTTLDRMIGPAWRRQGTGPTRLLLEALDRPWVSGPVRAHTLLTLVVISSRGYREPRFLDELYAPFSPSIPWASLLPPMLPGAAAGPESPRP